MGQQMVTEGWLDGMFYGCVMLTNIAGVMLMDCAAVRRPRLIGVIAVPIVFAMISLSDLLAFIGVGSRWHLCFVSAAMGAQNTLTAHGELGVNTTIITGNLQKIGMFLSKRTHADALKDTDVVAVQLCIMTVIATVSGAVCGTLWLLAVGSREWSLVLPALLQATCMLAYWRVHARGQVLRESGAESDAAPHPAAYGGAAGGLCEDEPQRRGPAKPLLGPQGQAAEAS